MTELSLTVSQSFAAPPARVYRAWLSADMLARFMLPGSDVSVPQAETDPRVGGRFMILMRAGDRDLPHAGTYRELVPDRRIRFTWESPFSTEGSEVTIDLDPEGAGTRLTLTHVRFPSLDSRDNHKAGWTRILAVLADILKET